MPVNLVSGANTPPPDKTNGSVPTVPLAKPKQAEARLGTATVADEGIPAPAPASTAAAAAARMSAGASVFQPRVVLPVPIPVAVDPAAPAPGCAYSLRCGATPIVGTASSGPVKFAGLRLTF